ncbi:helix-turn-helix domain-containing protein, partial [Streptomyces sp. NPDC001714]|uniref:helix-turn-helix domain-containing protein n=1 Tax=Streptomyces sp. NPDC001714 TaxID=3364603 RepID=UPI0036AE39ED
MDRNEGLSDFLRARRSAIDPHELGIEDASPRRVPGLRREELAALAGVSVDYYTRLEQGRPITPSESVLEALAQALQLDDAERSYLHAVARRPSTPRRRGQRTTQKVRPGVHALLARLGDTPAFRGRCVIAFRPECRAGPSLEGTSRFGRGGRSA